MADDLKTRERRFERAEHMPGGAPGPARRRDDSDGGAVSAAFGWLLALGILIAIVVAIVAWADDDTAGPERAATLTGIVDEPGEWYGQTVTISGEIGETTPLEDADAAQPAGAVAFTLGGDALGEQLLVVDADGAPPGLSEDSVVQVTGTVREFGATAFDDAFGFADDEAGWFDDAFFDGWDGRPAVVAQSVDPTVPPGEEG